MKVKTLFLEIINNSLLFLITPCFFFHLSSLELRVTVFAKMHRQCWKFRIMNLSSRERLWLALNRSSEWSVWLSPIVTEGFSNISYRCRMIYMCFLSWHTEIVVDVVFRGTSNPWFSGNFKTLEDLIERFVIGCNLWIFDHIDLALWEFFLWPWPYLIVMINPWLS